MQWILRNITRGVFGTLLVLGVVYLGFSYWAHHKLHGVVTFDWGRAVDTTPVHFEIDGHRLAIPKHYLYRRSDWGGGKVEGVLMEALLPDLQGYTLDNRAEFERWGIGKKVNLLLQVLPSDYSIEVGYERMKYGYSPVYDGAKPASMYGLQHLVDEYPRGSELFSLIEEGHATHFVDCDKVVTGRTSLCHTKLHYTADLFVEYSFSRDYLPEWRVVHENVLRLIQSFEEASTPQ